MKFSELASVYERIRGAASDPERVRLLAAVFRKADARTLEAAAHFTLSEVVDPQLSDRLGIGPGTLRSVLARMFRLETDEIDDPREIFDKLKGKQIIFEVKYDGARLQIHLRKNGRTPEIRFYSRRLNDDTAAMPDIASALAKAWKGGDAILEGEAVAFDPALRKKQPFQSVLMRLGRVHNIEEKAREIPLVLYLFELVYLDGE